MRTVIAIVCLGCLSVGCNSQSDEQAGQSDSELAHHLFKSEEFYVGYKDSNREQAERLLMDFLAGNQEFLRSGTDYNEHYYLSNIVLTKARLGFLRATEEDDSKKLERYLDNALPAYRKIQGEQAAGKSPEDLKKEIMVWVLALDLGEVSWLSRDDVASLGLTKELKEVEALHEQSNQR